MYAVDAQAFSCRTSWNVPFFAARRGDISSKEDPET